MNVRNIFKTSDIITSTATSVYSRHGAITLDWAQTCHHVPGNMAGGFDVLFSQTVVRHSIAILYRVVSRDFVQYCIVIYHFPEELYCANTSWK